MNEENFYAYGYDDVFVIDDASEAAITKYIEYNKEADIRKGIDIYHRGKHLYKFTPEASSNQTSQIEIYQMPGVNLMEPITGYIDNLTLEDIFLGAVYTSREYSLEKLHELQPIEYELSIKRNTSAGICVSGIPYTLVWHVMAFDKRWSRLQEQKWLIDMALFLPRFFSVSYNAQQEIHFDNEQHKRNLNTIEGDFSFYVPQLQPDQPVNVNDIIAGFYAASQQEIGNNGQENESQKYFFQYARPTRCDVEKRLITEHHASIKTFTSKQETLEEARWFLSEISEIAGEDLDPEMSTGRAPDFFYEIKEIKFIDVYDSNLIPNEKGELVQRYPNAGYVKRDTRGTLIYPGTSSFYEKQHLSDGTLLNEVMTEKTIAQERYFPRQVFTLHVDITLVNPTSKKEITLNMGIPGALFSITQ